MVVNPLFAQICTISYHCSKQSKALVIPIEIQKLDALASACKRATNNDFKALWYKKMIDLANKYNLMDYVMTKLVH